MAAKPKPRTLVGLAEPTHNGELAQMEPPRPCVHAERNAVDGDLASARSVLSLLLVRRPLAILRRIPSVVVDAVNAVLQRWPRPHVGHEGRERTPPLGADGNAPTAIPFVEVSVGVLASSNHVLPHSVLWRSTHAVRGMGGAAGFSVDAAATGRVPTLESSRRYFRCAAAVAAAFPVRLVVSIGDAILNSQSAKALPSQVISLHEMRIPQ